MAWRCQGCPSQMLLLQNPAILLWFGGTRDACRYGTEGHGKWGWVDLMILEESMLSPPWGPTKAIGYGYNRESLLGLGWTKRTQMDIQPQPEWAPVNCLQR